MLTQQEKDQLENIAKYPVVLFSPLQKFILPEVLNLLQKAHDTPETGTLINDIFTNIEKYIMERFNNNRAASKNLGLLYDFLNVLYSFLQNKNYKYNITAIKSFINFIKQCLHHITKKYILLNTREDRNNLSHVVTLPRAQWLASSSIFELSPLLETSLDFIESLDLSSDELNDKTKAQLKLLLTDRTFGKPCLRKLLQTVCDNLVDESTLTPLEVWLLEMAESSTSSLILWLCEFTRDASQSKASRERAIHILMTGLDITFSESTHRDTIMHQLGYILVDPDIGPTAKAKLFSTLNEIDAFLEDSKEVNIPMATFVRKFILSIIERYQLAHKPSVTYETTFPGTVPDSKITKASDTALILAGLKPKNPLIPPEPQSVTITQTVYDSEDEAFFDSSSDDSPRVSDNSDNESKSEDGLSIRSGRSFSS